MQAWCLLGRSSLMSDVEGVMSTITAPKTHHTTSRLEDQVRSLTERIVQLKGELARAVARADALTVIDDTSGLFVWRAFVERARTEISRATRYQREIGLVVLSLAQPDAMRTPLGLVELSEICRSKHRECDVAGQTETGEIVLLLPETSLQGALVMAQRIRAQATKSTGSAALKVGCAAWPQHGRTLTALLQVARNPLPDL
jgi:diguanylate cyclase (GGDEF)-like protein